MDSTNTRRDRERVEEVGVVILSDRDIIDLVRKNELVIEPFDHGMVRENGLDLSIGSNYCRLKKTDKVFDPVSSPRAIDFYECGDEFEFIIYPNERVLLHTEEYIKMPNYLAGLVNLRSSWARVGLYIPPTVVDAGFEGQLTIELIGSTFPVKVSTGMRLLHLILVKLNTPTSSPYRGRYQGQRKVRLPKWLMG